METAETYINALGGTVAVANALGLAPTTVSSWKSSGSIPRWRRSDLEIMALSLGVKTPEQFRVPDQQALLQAAALNAANAAQASAPSAQGAA